MQNRNQITWPEGKRVAISLSYDDARTSQVDVGLPIMDRHDVKGTFYVTAERVQPRLDGWHAAVANGHEIGNHSLHHSCSGNFGWKKARVLENYTLEEMEAELVEANEALSGIFGQVPITFAYPCGQTFVGRGVNRRSYVPPVARIFLVGRGFRDEYFNNPDFCDLAKVGGTEFDGVSFDGLLALTERAASLNAWMVLAGHEVSDSGRQTVIADALDRFCAYCKDPANGVWIDTVANIGTYVRDERLRLGLEL